MGLPGDGAAARADLQLRRRLLRARHRLQPHRDHRRPTSTGRSASSPSRASSPRSRPTRVARAARACASCATRTATGSSSSSVTTDGVAAARRVHLGGPNRRCRLSRLAVADLGSNSFRLVVFSATAERTAAAGGSAPTRSTSRSASAPGVARPAQLGERRDERAIADDRGLRALLPRRPGCDEDIDAVATSAIRDADQRRGRSSSARAARSGLEVRVLSREEEARYGYLAAVNSTTLRDGAVLDLGGGSMQLVGVEGRAAREPAPGALGAVRMTERFLAGDGPAAAQAAARAARPRRAQARATRRGCGVARPRASSASAARCATSRRRRSAPRRAAVVRRPGLRHRARRRSTSCRAARRAAARRAPPRAGDQAGARRHRSSPARSSIQAVLEAGGFDGDRGDRGRPARGRSSSSACSAAATRRCSTTCAARAS